MARSKGATASRVFVLGAGASYGAGFPLASDLFARVHERLQPDDQRDVDKAVRYFYPAARTARASPRSLSKKNIEEFMSLLDMAEEFNEILPTTILRPDAIRSLRSKLLRTIADLLIEAQREAEARRTRIEYVDRFISRLSVRDTVMTFNWDLLFERRLRQRGVSFDHCPNNSGSPALAFLKLHGSVDWFRGAELESRLGFDVIHRQLYRAPWPKINKRDAKSLANALPFIVPPTFFKTFRGCADVEEIWAHAFRRLQEADEIYVCGYRFPPEDLFARFVFRRAIRSNLMRRERKNATPLKLVVIGPNPAVARFLRRNIYGKVRHENSRFETSSLTK